MSAFDSHPSGASAGAPRARRTPLMLGTLAVVVVSLSLPFVLLPISESVTGAHTLFHVVGIVLCVGGMLVLRMLRRGASRTVKVLSWIVTVFLATWLIGHAGELATVFVAGGPAHDSEAFDDPAHSFFATIAVPSWVFTVLSGIVLLIVLAIQGLRTRRRALPSSR